MIPKRDIDFSKQKALERMIETRGKMETLRLYPEHAEFVINSPIQQHDILHVLECIKAECKRVKLQRNNYEEKLRLANRRINELEVKLKESKNL